MHNLSDYCNRYFEKVLGGFFSPENTEEGAVKTSQYEFRYRSDKVILDYIESGENAETYGYSITMTISNRSLTPEEMYLLMRAICWKDIREYQDEMKSEKIVDDSNYFQFVKDASSGSYEFSIGLTIILDYGVCFHVAYIQMGIAD